MFQTLVSGSGSILASGDDDDDDDDDDDEEMVMVGEEPDPFLDHFSISCTFEAPNNSCSFL